MSLNFAARELFGSTLAPEASTAIVWRRVPDLSVSQACAYGINFRLICHCFERRNHDALLLWVSADSKCEINTIRRKKRLQFHWKTITAKSEYGRQLWGYRFCNALRKHPFFDFGKFGLLRVTRVLEQGSELTRRQE